MTRDIDQAWSWINYWHTMRNVPVEDFTLSEFLPITNIYDLTGRHNMAGTYARLACHETVCIDDPYDDPGEYYLVRELDTLPGIFRPDELFEGIENLH